MLQADPPRVPDAMAVGGETARGVHLHRFAGGVYGGLAAQRLGKTGLETGDKEGGVRWTSHKRPCAL